MQRQEIKINRVCWRSPQQASLRMEVLWDISAPLIISETEQHQFASIFYHCELFYELFSQMFWPPITTVSEQASAQ